MKESLRMNFPASKNDIFSVVQTVLLHFVAQCLEKKQEEAVTQSGHKTSNRLN